MAQKTFNILPGYNTKFKGVDATCSCPRCDSRNCAGKPHDVAESCSCEDCREPKTCLYYSNRLPKVKDYSEATHVAQHAAQHLVQHPAQHNLIHYAVPSITHVTPKTTTSPLLCKQLTKTQSAIKELTHLAQKNKLFANLNEYPYKVDPAEYAHRVSKISNKAVGESAAWPSSQKETVEKENPCVCTEKPPPGFVIDIKTVQTKPINQKTPNHDPNWNRIEIPSSSYFSKKDKELTKEQTCCKSEKNECDPGYVYELPMSSNKLNNKLCECYESSGYLLDLSKYKLNNNEFKTKSHGSEACNVNRLETQITLTTTMNNCQCSDSVKNKYELPEYLPTHNAQELFNTLLQTQCTVATMTNFQKDGCAYQFLGKTNFDSPGYLYKLPKFTQECDKCNESALLQESQLYNVNRLESQMIQSDKKDNFECNDETKFKWSSKSPPKSLIQKSSKDQKEQCGCNESAKYKSESLEYMVDPLSSTQTNNCERNNSDSICVPKYPPKPQNKYKDQKKMSACNETSKNICAPKCGTESRKNYIDSAYITSELHGSVLELPKCTQKSQSKKCEYDESGKTKQKIECLESGKCNEPARKQYDSPGYVYELPKYKIATHGEQVYNINRLETQKTTSDIEENCDCNNTKKSVWVPKEPPTPQKKKKCGCNKSAECKYESSGYVFELPKHTQKNSCECNESAKYKKKLPAFGFDQQYNMAFVEELLQHLLNKQKNTIETLNNSRQKRCDEPVKSNTASPRYVYELPKYTRKPLTQKSSCECRDAVKPCRDSEKTKSESPRYVYPIPKEVPIPKISCARRETPKTKSKSPKNVFEQPQYTNKPLTPKNSCDSCRDSTKIKSESPGYVYELPKHPHKSQKKGCACREPTKTRSESPGYVCELPKHKQGKQKKQCDCTKKSKSEGYVVEVPKKPSNEPENIQVVNVNRLEAKRVTSDPKIVYKKMIGTQTNTIEFLKSLYVPNYKSPTPKKVSQSARNTFDLYKNMLKKQSETIETLKKIYLPQKSDAALELKYVPSPNSVKNSKCSEKKDQPSTENRKDVGNCCSTGTAKKDQPSTENRKDAGHCHSPGTAMKDQPPTENKKDVEHCCSLGTAKKDQPSTENRKQSGTAMLSAEVMDVSDKELNYCLTCKESNMSNKPKRISKYDFLKKLKDAYKACSCKVCECIAGKLVKPDVCKCEPCECTECLNYLKKIDVKLSSNSWWGGSKRGCEIYKRIQALKTAPESFTRQICDCAPCDCVECAKKIAKLCDCEPCQCVECKTRSIHQRQTLIVAPMTRQENVQRVACTCSPCDCIECGLVYPLPSTVMHEMSTDTNRHALCRCEICLSEICDHIGADSCKCQKRYKVVSKPVEKDIHDFDIREVAILHDKTVLPLDGKGTRHDTIAMFAVVPNQNPTFVPNNRKLTLSNTNTCSCDECECLTCQDDAINAIKSSQLFTSNEARTIFDMNVNNKSKLNSFDDVKRKSKFLKSCDASTTHFKLSCDCDTCNCLNCEKRLQAEPSNISCQYHDCESNTSLSLHNGIDHQCNDDACKYCYVEEIPRNAIQPSTHKYKIQRQNAHYGAINNKDSDFKMHDVNKTDWIFYELLSQSSEKPSLQSSIQTDSTSQKNHYLIKNYMNTRHLDHPERLNYKAYMQSQERSRETLNKNESTDNNIYESKFSDYSSFDTLPQASCHKYNGNIIRTSQNKNKSCESSCNSSGYDYPEYLIQFPKSTVETCLKDVLELDMKDTMNLGQFYNINEKHSVESQSYDEIPDRENNFLMDSNKTKTNIKEKAKSVNQQNKTIDYSDTFNVNNFSEHFLTDSNSCFDYKLELGNNLPLHLSHRHNKQCASDYKKSNINNTKGRNKILDSDYFTISKPYIDKPENRENINVIHKFDGHQYARKVESNTTSPSLPSCDETNTWINSKRISNSHFLNDVDALNTDDYKRVQKTLKEAKEFSLELMKRLKMYEKANKEFESISEKLQAPLVIPLGYKRREEKRINEDKFISQEMLSESSSVNGTISSTLISQEGKIFEKDLNNRENDNCTKFGICCVSSAKDKNIEEYLNIPKIDNSSFPGTVNHRGIRKEKKINKKNQKKFSIILKRDVVRSMRIRNKFTNAYEIKPDEDNVTVGRFQNLGSETGASTYEGINSTSSANIVLRNFQETTIEKRDDLSQIMRKLDIVFGSSKEQALSISTDTTGIGKDLEEDDLDNAGKNKLKETRPWSILKKNFNWDIKSSTKSKEVCIFHSLELEIKQGLQSISLQTAQPKKKVNLQLEVKKILDMPILQQHCLCGKEHLNEPRKTESESNLRRTAVDLVPYHHRKMTVDREVCCSLMDDEDFAAEIRDWLTRAVLPCVFKKWSELDHNVATITQKRSVGQVTVWNLLPIQEKETSCEMLKVIFRGVRRVSDHSVLVKWNLPRDLSRVQGYELLVDGRAVQKIFAPKETMTVLTCLPHRDKVLLTIRTITSNVSVIGHYPATTIVYKPRAK